MRERLSIAPVRLARAALIGLAASGLLLGTIAQAQTWSGPTGTAPGNNTPDLIWNSAAPGFSGSQNASFSISGSGRLGGQFAAGGYSLDAGGIAITAPSVWGTSVQGSTATFSSQVSAPQFCISGTCISSWPSGGGGGLDLATADARYVNVTGDTMTGNFTMNAGTVLSTPQICLAGDCRTVWPSGGGAGLDIPTADGRYVNVTGDAMSGTLTVNTPGLGPSVNASGVSGVQGVGTTSWGVRGVSTNTWGVLGESTNAEGVRGYGANAGGYFQDSNQSTTAYVAYGTYGFYTTSASNQMNGLTVAGTLTANSICLGGVCNSAWPAGGGGLDTPTADGRYVNVTGDSMTGGLNINGSSGSAILYANNSSGMGVYGEGLTQGARFRDSDSAVYTDIASGAYGIFTGATSNSFGGLQIAGGGAITLGGVARTSWPVRQQVYQSIASTAAAGWNVISCPAGGQIVGFSCFYNSTTPTGCATRGTSNTAMEVYHPASQYMEFRLVCITNL